MSASGTLEGMADIEDAYRSINFGRLKIAVFANDPTAKFDSRQFYRLARYPRQCVGHHGNYNERGERVVKVAQCRFRCGQATPSQNDREMDKIDAIGKIGEHRKRPGNECSGNL